MAGQAGKVLRQVSSLRHDGAFYQDRNDPLAACKGSLDFKPDYERYAKLPFLKSLACEDA